MNDLKGLDHVIDDKGKEVEFAGTAKDAFIEDVERAYPVFGAALNSLYETGQFLYEVRDRQKKHNLWMKYQEVIGPVAQFHQQLHPCLREVPGETARVLSPRRVQAGGSGEVERACRLYRGQPRIH